MKIKKTLNLYFYYKTLLSISIIKDIFERAFFKPKTKNELKKAVELWINDE